MKRTDLIRKLEEGGCAFVRHGGKHDWYRNPKTGVVPRHREIKEFLAEHIRVMSIDISSKNEARLKATAQAVGVSVDAYVERLMNGREELAAILARTAARTP